MRNTANLQVSTNGTQTQSPKAARAFTDNQIPTLQPKMSRVAHVFLLIICLTSLAFSTIVEITYAAAGTTAKSSNLARVSYDSTSLQTEVLSWTPPRPTDAKPASPRLFAIAVNDGGSTLTTLSTFNETLQQYITLHLDASGNAYSVTISARDLDLITHPADPRRSSKRDSKQKLNPQVLVIPPTPGPSAKLSHRKPVKVDESGKEIPAPEQEKEKTFLQKYWWVFLLVTILALGGGGDK